MRIEVVLNPAVFSRLNAASAELGISQASVFAFTFRDNDTTRQSAMRVGRQRFEASITDNRFVGEITLGSETIGFTLKGVRQSDRMLVTPRSDRLVDVRVIHSRPKARLPKALNCTVICSDGTQGQPCADCVMRGRTVRVCC